MWTSSAIPYMSLFYHQQAHTVIFIFFSCTIHYTLQRLFLLYVPCVFLIDHNQKQVLLIKWLIFLLKLKNFFFSFQLFEDGHLHNVASTLINVMKLYVENKSIVSTLHNVVNINIDLTLFNDVNFNVDIHDVVSTLIWYYPTSRRHMTLTATLEPHWKVSWVSKNVTKRLHNFVRFIKLKTYICSRIPLNCCFRKPSKRYW